MIGEARYVRWRARLQATTGRKWIKREPANKSFVSYWVSRVGGTSALAKILKVTPAAVSSWVSDGDFPAAQALKLGAFFHCPHHLFAWEVFRNDAGAPSRSELYNYFGFEG